MVESTATCPESKDRACKLFDVELGCVEEDAAEDGCNGGMAMGAVGEDAIRLPNPQNSRAKKDRYPSAPLTDAGGVIPVLAPVVWRFNLE